MLQVTLETFGRDRICWPCGVPGGTAGDGVGSDAGNLPFLLTRMQAHAPHVGIVVRRRRCRHLYQYRRILSGFCRRLRLLAFPRRRRGGSRRHRRGRCG